MRKMVPFVGGIILNLICWILIIRGIILLVLSQFTDVQSEIYFFTTVITALTIGIFIIVNIWFILKLTKESLFNENHSIKKNMLKGGLVGASSMAVVMAVAKFTPDIGLSFNLTWWVSLIMGAILWLVHFYLKKRES